ncbi:hypothetical protein LJC07_07920 [Christensenellaceae bacterium OttesenSCG-928-L17]|nr:hypothetical protein [Christensenellaceae bacterium OttesenSCG-928-L17]
MCKLFDEWKPEINKYCNENGLDFEKLKTMSRQWNKDMLVFTYHDKKKSEENRRLGVMDWSPLPDVLWISRVGNQLIFEQTEHTQQYLA